jgi:hypothetical protein
MTNFSLAAGSHIRNVVLCSVVTLGLAACGGASDGSSSTATASTDSVQSLVSPNVGYIDRSAADTTQSTTPASSTAGASNTAVPSSTSSKVVATTAPSTSSPTTSTPATGTTVASNSKSTTPVRTSNATGNATLDWMPPTENSDGSTLTNLAGYTVYYGTSPDNLTQSVKITNPGLTAYTVTDLPAGTWYFAVTSYSSAGAESSRTSTISTTI